MNEIRFDYKSNKLLFGFATILFLGMAIYFCSLAIRNEQGMVIFNIIKLPRMGASFVFIVLAIVPALLTFTCITTLISDFTTDKEVVISETSISAPHSSGVSKKTIQIKFAEINDIYVEEIENNFRLYILHPNGKLVIPKGMIPGKGVFEELVSVVTEKFMANKSMNTDTF